YVNGYNNGMALEYVLKAAGNDLSRDNIMKQALSIRDLELPLLLTGIKINTSATDHLPVEQVQFMRFTGKQWERFGEVLSTN
ncbi:branched-chain amino acid ABC transporter substrate-binding protein, partial [Lactobacillus crispatus]